ncbi:DUF6207 family protein [Streptomyces sp. NPDC015032]|uniref:DUF6207 family protein n=1 Tax=Streptomyces sp. NPDC015032 TaxID=3364937 RepID=UPI0036FA1882
MGSAQPEPDGLPLAGRDTEPIHAQHTSEPGPAVLGITAAGEATVHAAMTALGQLRATSATRLQQPDPRDGRPLSRGRGTAVRGQPSSPHRLNRAPAPKTTPCSGPRNAGQAATKTSTRRSPATSNVRCWQPGFFHPPATILHPRPRTPCPREPGYSSRNADVAQTSAGGGYPRGGHSITPTIPSRGGTGTGETTPVPTAHPCRGGDAA